MTGEWKMILGWDGSWIGRLHWRRVEFPAADESQGLIGGHIQ